MNIDTGLFKVSGYTNECNRTGKSWYKVGDVRKAFNMIPTNKEKFKIISFKIRIHSIKEL